MEIIDQAEQDAAEEAARQQAEAEAAARQEERRQAAAALAAEVRALYERLGGAPESPEHLGLRERIAVEADLEEAPAAGDVERLEARLVMLQQRAAERGVEVT